MKAKELVTKEKKQLLEMLEDKQKSLREFRFAIRGSKIKNMKEGRATRKDIARILTVINAQ